MKDLLHQLAELKISLLPEGASLTIHDPMEKLTEELLSAIKENKATLLELLKDVSQTCTYRQISPAPKKECYTLSSVQRRLYFLHALEKTAVAYNMPKVITIEGNLDVQKLERVFNSLVERHEGFRTRFELCHGEPVQVIQQTEKVNIEYHCADETSVPELITQFVQPFDLSVGPLLRVSIIILAVDRHLLLVDMPHIIADGISYGLLIRDFMHLYMGDNLPPISLTYKDFSEWQQSPEQQAERIGQKEFWMRTFSGDLAALELPTDFPRPAMKNYAGDVFSFPLERNELEKLHLLCRKENVTPYQVMLALYAVLLSKLTGNEDIVIGTPSAGRDHADLEKIIGMFVNTIPLRIAVQRNISFKKLLAEVKAITVASFDNQGYSYETLIEALNPERDTSRNPLFDTLFVFQNFEQTRLEIPGLRVTPYPTNSVVSKFDMTFTVLQESDGAQVQVEYSTSLFHKNTIERFAAYFQRIMIRVLQSVDVSVEAIDILPDGEKHTQLEQFNNTRAEYPDAKTVVDLFHEQVEKTPDNIAVVCGNTDLSYRELDEYSNHIAHSIKATGNTSALAAVYAEPSLEMVIAILGALKADRAFLPLDVNQNPNRQEEILKSSGCGLLLVQQPLEGKLNFDGTRIVISRCQRHREPSLNNDSPANRLLYVIYTSGSTGKPKGVKISHANLMNYFTWFKQTCQFSGQDKVLLTTSYAFDAVYTQFFGALLTGAELHVISRETYLSPGDLIAYIDRQEISFLKMTPTLFNTVISDKCFTSTSFARVRLLMLGGEPIHGKDVASILATHKHIRVMNHYGPTETTIGSIAQYIDPAIVGNFVQRPVIGKPIGNTQCYILDPSLRLQPLGCKGELYIGGDGVGMGYLGLDELTNQKFIPNPFRKGERLYRTGDLARWTDTGIVECLGRTDNQVKIRGFRIELGEIEIRLTAHDSIREAIVNVKAAANDKKLIAYYVSEKELDQYVLHNYLHDCLQDYMIPSAFVWLKQMPLTPNGKVDRKALPDANGKIQSIDEAPKSVVQKQMVKIWSNVLVLPEDKIGIHANFFELGGHSISIVKLNQMINAEFGCSISVAQMFRLPTIAALEEYIIKGERGTGNVASSIDQAVEEANKNLRLLSDLMG